MIPILYEANETAFTTLGIGPLGDAIKCVVTEELNGEYELEMTYPVSGIHYSELVEDRLIYAVPFEGGRKQIFKIYQIEKPLDGEVVVRAEHIHYLLNKMVVMPFSASSAAGAMAKIKSNVVEDCPFTFATDKTLAANLNMVVPIECGKLLGGTEGSILDIYGPGEYEFDNFNVTLRAHRGSDNGVTVRFGKNMTELDSSVDTTNVYTGIVPYYRDSEDNITYADGYVVWSGHKTDYVYPLAKVVDVSSWFDSERESWEKTHPDEVYAPSSDDIITKARNYLQKNAGWDKSVNIKVSFVNPWQSDEYADLAALERVKMGDTVSVINNKIGVSTTKKVIKTEYNVLLDRYDSIELGTPTTSMTSEIANTSTAIAQASAESKSMMQKAIEHATKLITGGLGGYVVINTNANGNPNEILIMDTPNKETAVNVWRFNLNGLGHSHSGYNGPFDDVALTQDGQINADLITAGTLNANVVRAGLLTDGVGKNYWDLETGEFRLSANTTVGGQTVQKIADDARSAAERTSAAQLASAVSTINEDISGLQDQIDGNITTWYYPYKPTLSNLPASDWKTTTDKNNHIGDLFYDKNTGYCYRFMLDVSTYKWIQISDEDIAAAMAAANEAQDTADNKRRIFIKQPTPPYDVGDTWMMGTTGDIKTCTTAKTASQSYSASDWSKLNKYTDDSAVSNFITGTYSSDKLNLQNQIDGKAETWYQSSDPSTAWTNATLKAKHEGDLWYNTTNNTTWIYYKSGSTYSWKQENVPNEVFDKIDGKAQVFTSQPIPPYDVGDIWFMGTTGDILTCINKRTTGTYTVSDWEKRNKYTDDSALSSFISGTYSNDKTNLQSQVDKKAETWYQGTDPSTAWTTTALKKQHVGDLWYNTTNNTTWFYNSSYKWQQENVPTAVFDKIDGKAQIFTSPPTPPYAVGDLWCKGASGDILTCIKSRTASESYTKSDWAKKNKYTDDSALTTWISGTYSSDKTNLQSQVDKKAETWYQSADPATAWNTAALKKQHVGDLWYKTSNKTTWIYYYDSSAGTYSWKQENVPDEVFDKIDGKAQIFTSTPTPPYNKGDLWCEGTSGDILTCVTAKTASQSYAKSDWAKRNKYTDNSALNSWISGTYAKDKTDLQTQIDGKAQTWYQASDPSTAWTNTTLKAQHVGDLWYRTSDAATFFYNSSYTWVKENVPNEVFDKIDGKAQIFTTTPKPPYDVGDLWCQGSSGDILTCVKTRSSGSYTKSDWSKMNNYVDTSDVETVVDEVVDEVVDGAISEYDESLNQAAVFNKLTKNGTARGIYMNATDNQLYINATYIATGTLTDDYGKTTFNLKTGKLTTKNFSVKADNFELTDTGIMTATGATLSGTFSCGSDDSGQSKITIGDGNIGFNYGGSSICNITATRKTYGSTKYDLLSIIGSDIFLCTDANTYVTDNYDYIRMCNGSIVLNSTSSIILKCPYGKLEISKNGCYLTGTTGYGMSLSSRWGSMTFHDKDVDYTDLSMLVSR